MAESPRFAMFKRRGNDCEKEGIRPTYQGKAPGGSEGNLIEQNTATRRPKVEAWGETRSALTGSSRNGFVTTKSDDQRAAAKKRFGGQSGGSLKIVGTGEEGETNSACSKENRPWRR